MGKSVLGGKVGNRVRTHSRVELVDDERAIGNSIIVTLKQGWTHERGIDARVFSGDTWTEVLSGIRAALPFSGPYDP